MARKKSEGAQAARWAYHAVFLMALLTFGGLIAVSVRVANRKQLGPDAAHPVPMTLDGQTLYASTSEAWFRSHALAIVGLEIVVGAAIGSVRLRHLYRRNAR